MKIIKEDDIKKYMKDNNMDYYNAREQLRKKEYGDIPRMDINLGVIIGNLIEYF
jgi:hypothetical protein